MTDKQLADIVCRALLAIVAGLRKKYDLPNYHNIVLIVQDQSDVLYLEDRAQIAKGE